MSNYNKLPDLNYFAVHSGLAASSSATLHVDVSSNLPSILSSLFFFIILIYYCYYIVFLELA
uniref:Uncharacterized protein n=1 Tax=Physcomitrium patens TaxID=3218 RepID=A0A2K1L9P5_PHYPA|nr:hypothetical protein PHYPA_001155 [Physcomitrium patens]